MNKIHSVLRNLLCINTRNNSTIMTNVIFLYISHRYGCSFFHRTKTSKEDEAPELKNLPKQNVQQSSENEQLNRNSKQNTTDRAAVINRRKGKSTHHLNELENLPKKQKVQKYYRHCYS